MGRAGGVAWLVGGLLVGVVLVLGLVLTVLQVLQPRQSPTGCGPLIPAAAAGLRAADADLTAGQLSNASRVIAEGRRRGVADRGIVIALAVASQESRFRNYANVGVGGDLDFTQVGIERSLSLPHEAVGSDHGSLGVFQQQWPWWGSMHDLMNPTRAAGKFFEALGQVRGWQSMPVTVAAQRVQRSAYPTAYADDERLARSLLAASRSGSTTVSSPLDPRLECEPASLAGAVVFPLPAGSGYVDQRNWGVSAAVWSRGHTGTDFSVACGTPVLAATSGTVDVRTDQPWSGRWLVQVSTGASQLTTWYAHMQHIDVSDGQPVAAGQRIGAVGSEGNSTGCHLHFEVHPRGGSIYQDNVNPTEWLATHVGLPIGGTVPASQSSSTIRVATFNVLGASHTAAGGKHAHMASGRVRTHGLVRLLAQHPVDVAGLQEFQTVQHRTFGRLAGATYAAYHARGDTENAIVWRRDRFRFAGGRTFAVPYFNGLPRRMPIVRLTDRRNGKSYTFINIHNPADTRRFPRQRRWRDAALRTELRVVRAEHSRGHKVIIMGDFNDRRSPLCFLAARAQLRAAGGGRVGAGSCRPVARAGIDWILASHTLGLGSRVVSRNLEVRRTSDHPLIVVPIT